MLRTALPNVKMPLPGPKASALKERRAQVIPSAIGCGYPLAFARGEGAMVEDVDGNVFLDWVGGVGVMNVGYAQPDVLAAIHAQADRFTHCMFNIGTHEPYVALAEKLAQCAPVRGDKKKAYFANSGAEGVENAVKLARSFTGRPNIIVFTSAFHGRTSLTMEMSWEKTAARGVGPFPNGVYRSKYPYLYHAPKGMTEAEAIDYYVQELEDVLRDDTLPEYTAAIVIEPVLGNGGFVPAPLEWVKRVRKICDDHGILLIADEIQCGMGRSGKLFASGYWADAGCAPDILIAAKSIAGGIPLSAIVAREEIAEAVLPGVIGGTYCGNAVACAAGLAVFEVIERDGLLQRASEIGEKVLGRMREWMAKYDCIGDVRGLGSMIGIEFVEDRATKKPAGKLVGEIVKECAQNGLIIEAAGEMGNSIRFLAPLVMTDAQTEAGLAILEAAIAKCEKE